MKLLISFFFIFGLLGSAHSNPSQSQLVPSSDAREDFETLFKTLQTAHANLFVNRTKIEYQNKYDEILVQLDGDLTAFKVKMLFQEFIAYGRIAHASLSFLDEEFSKYRDQGGKAFPVYVRIDNNKWWIAEDYSGKNLTKEDQITHINDIPVEAIFDEIWRYLSADTKEIASSLLEYKLPQYLWLLDQRDSKPSDTYTLRIEKNGKEFELKVNPISREELQLKVEQQANESNKETEPLRDYKLLANKIGYLKPGPFYNAEDQSDLWNATQFTSFIDKAFESFLKNEVTQLVIDVRKNPGGTNSFSDAMIAWYADKPFKFASHFMVRSSFEAKESNRQRIKSTASEVDSASAQLAGAYEKHPFGTVFEFNLEEHEPRKGQRFQGDVYVLIDRHSYSNAASVAAITQDYGFGTVVGQTTTDFATTFASMESFVLPNTGTKVGFPKAHIIRPSGDKKPGPVIPDIQLATDNTLGELVKRLTKVESN